MNEYMTLKEAAERSGRQDSTLRRAAQRGTLKAVMIGRDWLVTPSALQEYVERADAQERGKHMKKRSDDERSD